MKIKDRSPNLPQLLPLEDHPPQELKAVAF